MSASQEVAFALILIFIIIGLFIFSNKQKKAHTEKMAQMRHDRRAKLDALKQAQNRASDVD